MTRGWQFYGTPNLQVVPYIPGTPVYVDGILADIYVRLKREGRIAAAFCGDDKTMDQFISYIDRIKTAQILCTVGSPEDPQRLTPVGFSWVDNPHGEDGCRIAMPGQVFFSGTARVSRHLAYLGLAYLFEDLRIDVLHGVQLVTNYAARNFAVKCGFKQVAVIPKGHVVNGQYVDARIMMLEKEEYMPRFLKWYESVRSEQNAVEMIDAPG